MASSDPQSDDDPTSPSQAKHDSYAVMRIASYRFFLAGNVTAVLGMQMQGVAINWEIYERTNSAFSLALIGLVQVFPVFALTFLIGYVADRFDRRRVLIAGLMIIASASLGMAITSYLQGPVWIQFVLLFFTGVGRCFQQPLKNSLLPLIVPRSLFANAVTWSMGGFQFSAVMGPVIGGLLLAILGRAAPIYLFDAVAASIFALAITQVVLWNDRERSADEPPAEPAQEPEPLTLSSLGAGVKFIWNHPVILGAMWLDMFGVLFGGATNLFPIYATDILKCGPSGLGWMRAAPAIGSLAMSIYIAHRPPLRHAGFSLLIAVAGFGLATIGFGFSRWLPLSLAFLIVAGMCDNVSVIVRHTLMQLLTPDRYRGRVSAANSMFISVSNELGEFESGTVAGIFTRLLGVVAGTTIAVVSGGVGTLIVVVITALGNPALRKYGRLDTTVDEQLVGEEEERAPD